MFAATIVSFIVVLTPAPSGHTFACLPVTDLAPGATHVYVLNATTLQWDPLPEAQYRAAMRYCEQKLGFKHADGPFAD